MNILVYTGSGTSRVSVSHTVSTLKALLGHLYDVIQVDAKAIAEEPWSDTCSLLVVPGGRDIPYTQDLAGKGNQRIHNYVKAGGRYFGICAGAYYGSAEIEFEKGDADMEVSGSRELAFYPGLCKGTVFPGFVYNSEKGARAVPLRFNGSLLPTLPGETRMYYNGGGYFVNPDQFSSSQVQVLAWFKDEPDLAGESSAPNTSPRDKAAIVQTFVGKGIALLSGVHPEINATKLDPTNIDYNETLIKDLGRAEATRKSFLRAAFAKIGLDIVGMTSGSIGSEESIVPDLTPLYLYSARSEITQRIVSSIFSIAEPALQEAHFLQDSHDTFRFSTVTSTQPTLTSITSTQKSTVAENEVTKDNEPPKHVIFCPITPPAKSATPLFDIHTFFECLDVRRQVERELGVVSQHRELVFGSTLLYGEVVTSTQTMLDKNFKLSKVLPTGFACAATRQVSGRGRGRNSWISPPGCLQFSLVIHHSLSLNRLAPAVFIQYLISLAVVESVRSKNGYGDVPLRLKWPNDIYAEVEEERDGKGEIVLKKIGGVLVNSNFTKDEFMLVIGCGVNLTNPNPTTSVNHMILAYNKKHDTCLKTFSQEEMLADILVTFERFYARFCERGFDPWFEQLYYRRWLHSDKLVTLTTHDNVLVRITGITTDFGLLKTVGVDAGEKYELQPDGNSFDMLKGLIAKKM